MSTLKVRPMYGAAGVAAAVGTIAGIVALHPAFAAGGIAQIGPFTVVHCASSSYCEEYDNHGKGVGVEGVNSNASSGVVAVEGNATGGGSGVAAYSSYEPVLGTATSGMGVYGASFNGVGGEFIDTAGGGGIGVLSNTGVGVTAVSGGTAPTIESIANVGPAAVQASSQTPAYTMEVSNSDTTGGDGLEAIGNWGLWAEMSSFPVVATDQDNNNLFWIDGKGGAHAYAYKTIARARDGAVEFGYAPRTTAPTIEDDGTGRLIDGVAVVRLDAVFADSIDNGQVYHVMLTPDGDANGLYVASKTPTEFVVHETQGGRDTLDFDYHIYASRAGEAGVRMAEMTPAQAYAMEPHAPIVKPRAKQAKIHTKQGWRQL